MQHTATISRMKAAGAPPRLSGFAQWADRHFKWLLVAPAVLLILALSVYPLLFSLVVSFINYDFQVPGHAFVGLKNFERVVFDPVARWSLLLTAWLSGISVAIEFVLGLLVALTMVRNFPGRGVIMSILIVPLFISPVIVGQAWTLLLQRPFGPTNYILTQLLGQEVTIGWMTESPWLYFSLIIADVWQWTPFMFVILLAGLTAIPPNLYEAAELDGVNAWQAFWAITLPHLAPMMLLALTFRLLDAIRMFDTIFIMTGGGPGTRTYTASYYLYTVGFTQFHLSQATAGSWLFLIFAALVVMLLVRRLLKTEPV
ncbi:sugar ABC transporter permease [Mesorhizobium sp.]|uniref:carbohydrate ABC transporter permease n=1 Tax=Mesorhizobium sp. TaxID=1871066 RepID=UPI000FE46295|nr:sugar ABC transporter permease [Mesorhizobium sp.]RWK62467.1 MAG: sugar ABC transporter permease [Mesorhizobium sp.]RWM43808.1 MAG: sugar ABC transporter permease [Mesorhizobium sp.]RWM57846.1 MAG: sugar ABC transporter permease [Mesorhizobium sp.]RWM59196.1 MAG: sugar ABC transporter permease [Mesorhizobium sp.]RWM97600.1 MAG: sugar ABC transporter permease [Mesorhizobium sp.]